MSAFTVGHTESYDKGLREGYAPSQGFPVGSPIMKLGRTDDLHGDGSKKFYGGGCVFPDAAAAAAFLTSIGKEAVWSVYEIDADYEHDCCDDEDGEPFRRLLKDARVIRKVLAA